MSKEKKEKIDEVEEQETVQENNIDALKELQKLKETIANQKNSLDEKEDRYRRIMAEFENYKKRSTKEREGMYNSLVGDIISSMLPVLDNLEKAMDAKTEDENYKKGIELVYKQFKDVLTANGVTEIEAVGKTFDPELHEAVAQVEDENLGQQEVKEEYRKGYKIGDKVIRHSMVIVAN